MIADDSELNRTILANTLDLDYEIIEVCDGREAVTALEIYHGEISALLLDVMMPELDGFGVLEEMRRRGWIDEIPTIMISAETGSAYINRAFDLGASDYISRPFVPGIIRRRIVNTILLHTKKQQLMEVVSSRLYRRERNNEVIVSILDHAMEYRSGAGGKHMSGVDRLTGLLLRRLLEKTDRYALSQMDVEVICMASGLHDIGKLMIPEDILKKPSRLTPEEFEIVKQHTVYGADIIRSLPVYQNESLVKYAMEICRWHHERWNGEGYPDGLVGDAIPIAAQVVSLADAYDALTSERPYKSAYSHDEAIAMIHDNQCGSFNPLLLECMDDLGEALCGSAAAERSTDTALREMRSLYSVQGVNTTRMTRQLEEANAKQDFFIALSDELWFEYMAQPASLQLSKGAVARTGLPTVTVDPLNSHDFFAIIGEETVARLRNQLAELTSEDTYTEFTASIVLDGAPRRCRLAVEVIWSATEQGRFSTLIGRVIDIDESYRRLEALDAEADQRMDETVLVPVLAGVDDVLKLSRKQVGPLFQGLRRMYQIVRLVDPGICMQVTADERGHQVEQSENCYAVWGKQRRCENCISQQVIRGHRVQTKVETIGSEVYYVLAVCVEVDGVPYSLECVNRIRVDDTDNAGEENILNQLLVRNRQVYTDSATRVFNRRYYDDRLRTLTGEYALAMMDIDHFKQINDRFGHPAGDAALYRVAQTIRSILRSNDELVRYGGDEFFLLFHGLPEHILQRKLNEICEAVRGITFEDYPGMHVSTSIGGIYGQGRISELIQRADTALYQAKKTHDCAVVYKEEQA